MLARSTNTGTWIGQTVKGLGTFVTGGLGHFADNVVPGRHGDDNQGAGGQQQRPEQRPTARPRLGAPDRPPRVDLRRGPASGPRSSENSTGVLPELLAFVNVFIGVLNLVPLLPLDGGHVAIAIYERIRSMRGRRHFDRRLPAAAAHLRRGARAVGRDRCRRSTSTSSTRSGCGDRRRTGRCDIGESVLPVGATRQVMVGAVPVGGGAPITVQSMTITKTADVEGTLQQIYALAAAGADIVRCTCNEVEAAEGLAQIVPRSPVPIVADIHHQYRMALAALEAGVHCLRLNPGNIRKPEHIKAVAQECKDRGIPIRIGVNGGCLDPKLYEKHGGRVTPEAMVESAQQELAYFREVDFDDVKISVKASSVPLMIEAYRLLADAADHPLHLGVTEAGPAAGRACSRPPPASPRCWPRASATPSATRSPPTRSRRPAPGASCSRRSACASARTSTSSPARPAGGPRST